MIVFNTPVVYGIPEKVLPVAGIPAGAKVKFRFRAAGFAKVFIFEKNRVSQHYIEEPKGSSNTW